MRRTIAPAAMLVAGFCLVMGGLQSGAVAAEVKVLGAAVMRPIFAELTEPFEHATGHKLIISYVPAGAVRRQVEGGEAFDVAIVQRSAGDELVRMGKIEPRMTTLSRSGLAIAVRRGMPKPDIS